MTQPFALQLLTSLKAPYESVTSDFIRSAAAFMFPMVEEPVQLPNEKFSLFYPLLLDDPFIMMPFKVVLLIDLSLNPLAPFLKRFLQPLLVPVHND